MSVRIARKVELKVETRRAIMDNGLGFVSSRKESRRWGEDLLAEKVGK